MSSEAESAVNNSEAQQAHASEAQGTKASAKERSGSPKKPTGNTPRKRPANQVSIQSFFSPQRLETPTKKSRKDDPAAENDTSKASGDSDVPSDENKGSATKDPSSSDQHDFTRTATPEAEQHGEEVNSDVDVQNSSTVDGSQAAPGAATDGVAVAQADTQNQDPQSTSTNSSSSPTEPLQQRSKTKGSKKTSKTSGTRTTPKREAKLPGKEQANKQHSELEGKKDGGATAKKTGNKKTSATAGTSKGKRGGRQASSSKASTSKGRSRQTQKSQSKAAVQQESGVSGADAKPSMNQQEQVSSVQTNDIADKRNQSSEATRSKVETQDSSTGQLPQSTPISVSETAGVYQEGPSIHKDSDELRENQHMVQETEGSGSQYASEKTANKKGGTCDSVVTSSTTTKQGEVSVAASLSSGGGTALQDTATSATDTNHSTEGKKSASKKGLAVDRNQVTVDTVSATVLSTLEALRKVVASALVRYNLLDDRQDYENFVGAATEVQQAVCPIHASNTDPETWARELRSPIGAVAVLGPYCTNDHVVEALKEFRASFTPDSLTVESATGNDATDTISTADYASKFPSEYKKMISGLVHGSAATLPSITDSLCKVLFDKDPNQADEKLKSILKATVQVCMRRKNYGASNSSERFLSRMSMKRPEDSTNLEDALMLDLRSDVRYYSSDSDSSTSVECLWRWESIVDDVLPAEVKQSERQVRKLLRLAGRRISTTCSLIDEYHFKKKGQTKIEELEKKVADATRKEESEIYKAEAAHEAKQEAQRKKIEAEMEKERLRESRKREREEEKKQAEEQKQKEKEREEQKREQERQAKEEKINKQRAVLAQFLSPKKRSRNFSTVPETTRHVNKSHGEEHTQSAAAIDEEVYSSTHKSVDAVKTAFFEYVKECRKGRKGDREKRREKWRRKVNRDLEGIHHLENGVLTDEPVVLEDINIAPSKVEAPSIKPQDGSMSKQESATNSLRTVDGRVIPSKFGRCKFLSFFENNRPPYWGTFIQGIQNFTQLNGRRPFLKEPNSKTNYEIDSDEEWENDEEDGDDIESESASQDGNDDDNEQGDGQEKKPDQLDYTDPWLVEDDQITYEDGSDGDTDCKDAPEGKKKTESRAPLEGFAAKINNATSEQKGIGGAGGGNAQVFSLFYASDAFTTENGSQFAGYCKLFEPLRMTPIYPLTDENTKDSPSNIETEQEWPEEEIKESLEVEAKCRNSIGTIETAVSANGELNHIATSPLLTKAKDARNNLELLQRHYEQYQNLKKLLQSNLSEQPFRNSRVISLPGFASVWEGASIEAAAQTAAKQCTKVAKQLQKDTNKAEEMVKALKEKKQANPASSAAVSASSATIHVESTSGGVSAPKDELSSSQPPGKTQSTASSRKQGPLLAMFQNRKASASGSQKSLEAARAPDASAAAAESASNDLNNKPSEKQGSPNTGCSANSSTGVASKTPRPSLPAKFRAFLRDLSLVGEDQNQKVDISLYTTVVHNLQQWNVAGLNELTSPSEKLTSFVCNRRASTVCRAISLAIMNQILLRMLNRDDEVCEETLKNLATVLLHRKVVQELPPHLPKSLSKAKTSKEGSRFLVDLCRYFIILCSFQKDKNETLKGLVEEVVNDVASHLEDLLPCVDNALIEPSTLDFRQTGQDEGDVRKHVLAMIEAILRWDGKHLHLQRCSDAFLSAAEDDRLKFLGVTSATDEASSKYILWICAQLAFKISTSDTLTKTEKHANFVRNTCLSRFPKTEQENTPKLPPNLAATYSTYSDLTKDIEKSLQ
eukprot:gb/GECG01003522.1/.p1 GENE.gb/GECG01003522.1/~~gb/GECG01003522.1/.p1  ORF type:complete len:1770 (+),score=332.84 gb/GECG01003522.1/:1-5310(+)